MSLRKKISAWFKVLENRQHAPRLKWWQSLLRIREVRECGRSSPLQSISPLPNGFTPQPSWPCNCTHPTLCFSGRTRTPPLWSLKFRNLQYMDDRIVVFFFKSGACLRAINTCISAEQVSTHWVWNRKRCSHKAISPAQAVRAPSLLVRKCSRPKVHSNAANLWVEYHTHETAFPNYSATCSWKHSSCLHLGVTSFDNLNGCCCSSLKVTSARYPPCPTWRGVGEYFPSGIEHLCFWLLGCHNCLSQPQSRLGVYSDNSLKLSPH